MRGIIEGIVEIRVLVLHIYVCKVTGAFLLLLGREEVYLS